MKVGEFRPLQNPVRTLTFFVILPGEGFLDLVADQGKSDLEPLRLLNQTPGMARPLAGKLSASPKPEAPF